MLDKTVSFRLDENTYENLLRMAAGKQNDELLPINITDIIRELIEDRIKKEDKDFVKICEEYVPIGRKILKPHFMKKDEEHFFIKRDICTKSYNVPRRGRVPDVYVDNEELNVPTHRIALNPQWDMDFETDFISERILEKSRDSLNRMEDSNVFQVLQYGTPTEHSLTVIGTITSDSLWVMYNLLREHEIIPKNVITHPWMEEKIKIWQKELYESFEEINDKNEINILTSTMCPKYTIYMASSPDLLGVMPIRKDFTIIDCDDPKNFKFGKILYKNIGYAVINDYCLVKCSIVQEGKTNEPDGDISEEAQKILVRESNWTTLQKFMRLEKRTLSKQTQGEADVNGTGLIPVIENDSGIIEEDVDVS